MFVSLLKSSTDPFHLILFVSLIDSHMTLGDEGSDLLDQMTQKMSRKERGKEEES